ncbi:MAG TPA: hypothetical protein VIM65_13010 [Cyclobacteriaceae bacterium]
MYPIPGFGRLNEIERCKLDGENIIGRDRSRECKPAVLYSYATNMLDLPTDLYTVSKLLDHRSVKTAQIYAQVCDKMKQAAVKSLLKLNFTSR